MPDTGSTFHLTPKRYMADVARTKTGTAPARSRMSRRRWSARVSCLTADQTPTPSPTTVETAKAVRASLRVTGKRAASDSATGRPVTQERPRSPRRTWPSHLR